MGVIIKAVCYGSPFTVENISTSLSILIYLITLEDRRGTTDEFATISFHLILLSSALVKLAKSVPVQLLILPFLC